MLHPPARALLALISLVSLAGMPARGANPAPARPPAMAPAEIVATAPDGDWTRIDPADLVVMDLAPDAQGRPRRVVIQLLPAPFSQGWIGNIRTLAAAHWWDGTSINRVQDNYVVQWGDPDGEDKARAKPLPPGLARVPQEDYTSKVFAAPEMISRKPDAYAPGTGIDTGWPVGFDKDRMWPLHCYGMVGVGRDMPPDTGSGAELYAVIGHAPRQLDRNIALVGRVIDGMEHLSSLPRGTGEIGFYKTAAERTPILSVRQGSGVPGLPAYQYLATISDSFRRYADARANRRDPFYVRPAGGVDICNLPVPVRRAK
ncbi:MAG: peptidylprolyl isomerase [Novosphingobium sp. SCN 66-18]|mgnify:CR=1 FL=1|nr:MAG: peptidylprolyl isomerase [Novosphingobium sp. SCN 66-18]